MDKRLQCLCPKSFKAVTESCYFSIRSEIKRFYIFIKKKNYARIVYLKIKV